MDTLVKQTDSWSAFCPTNIISHVTYSNVNCEEADFCALPCVTCPLYFGPRVEEVVLGIFPTSLVAKNSNRELRDLKSAPRTEVQ